MQSQGSAEDPDFGSIPAQAATDGTWAAGVPDFDHPGLLDELERTSLDRFDELDFGLITMDRMGAVIGYNAFESRRARIARERVLGRNFFADVGPCTNNYLIAQRYLDCPDLDEQLDYVFTLRMEPTPVRLRLLARTGSARQYLAVRSR